MKKLLSALLDRLGVTHTFFYLQHLISRIGSLESITHLRTLLSAYRLDTMAVKITEKELPEVPLPALVMLREESRVYGILEKVGEETIQVFWKGQSEQFSREEFLKKWTGYTLLIQKNEHSGEPNYEENLKKERQTQRKKQLQQTGIAVLVLLVLGYVSFTASWLTGAFLFLHLVGLGLSAVLLSGEFSVQSDVFNKACSALSAVVGVPTNDTKTDSCQQLSGKEEYKFLGFSWAEIGVFYFSAGTLGLVFAPRQMFEVLTWLGLFGIVAVAVSLYVQGVQEKKWCRLCLAVMGVLALELVLSVWEVSASGFALPTVSGIVLFTVALGLVCALYQTLKPTLKNQQAQARKIGRSSQFKYNPEVFQRVQEKEPWADLSTLPRDFVAGNPKADVSLVMVSRPSCPPCKRAKEEIKTLLQDFGHLIDLTTCHLTYENSADEKEIFGNDQDTAAAHRNWVRAQGISYTPAYVLNGQILHQQYSPEELGHFLLGEGLPKYKSRDVPRNVFA